MTLSMSGSFACSSWRGDTVLVLGLRSCAGDSTDAVASQGALAEGPGLREAMARDTILLTRRTNMWLAWVGFNLSHSLGAVLFGVVVVLIGRSQATFEAQGAVFLPLATLVSGTYLVLAIRYWFRAPIVGITLSPLCFAASWACF